MHIKITVFIEFIRLNMLIDIYSICLFSIFHDELKRYIFVGFLGIKSGTATKKSELFGIKPFIAWPMER